MSLFEFKKIEAAFWLIELAHFGWWSTFLKILQYFFDSWQQNDIKNAEKEGMYRTIDQTYS